MKICLKQTKWCSKLYYDNSKSLQTTSGATVTGTLAANSGGGTATLGSHLDLGDNQKVRLPQWKS